jgi:hypothetical protein
MGLFDFLKEKKAGQELKDLVWMNSEAKLKGFLQLQQLHPEALYVAWFEDTQKEYEQISGHQISIKMAHGLLGSMTKDKIVVFLEHYPLRSREEVLVKHWQAKEILVLSSLDEPLFQCFGSSNIVPLLEKLGADTYEMLTHPLIGKSIQNAQGKLDKKMVVESKTNSAEEWFRKNIRDSQLS